MEETKNSFTERTLEIWQPRTGRVLTHEDARQIVENITGFFEILLEWDSTDGLSDKARPEHAAVQGDAEVRGAA